LGPPALFEAIEKRFYARPKHERLALVLASRSLRLLPSKRLRSLARRRLFRDVDAALGGRVRALLTGSAPSKHSTLAFYRWAGVPLFQAYGLAEVGFIAWNRPGHNRPSSVGRPVFADSVSLAPDGEIIMEVQHPQALGYLGLSLREERQTFLADGRIATGDLGRMDRDGYLYITGRKKDIIITQGGLKIHPQEMELTLASTPGVDRAVVIGGGELPALAVIIALDTNLDEREETRIREQTESAVAALNARARTPASRIERVYLTREPFDVGSGLLTRNLKLDRVAVQRRFEPLLDHPRRGAAPEPSRSLHDR
jgi:long-subunit acyl-CoA synthetase (AMP-forming)